MVEGDTMKQIKCILILVIFFMTLVHLNNTVYAKEDTSTSANRIDVIDHVDDFKPSKIGSESKLAKRVGIIFGVINVIGILLSVMTLMVLGLKYMLGSVEEKAEYKKSMGMYLLGVFLVISITTVPNIIYKVASSI